MARGKEDDRSGAGEESYAVVCTRCKISKRNGRRFLRSSCCTCKVRLVSTWIKRREVNEVRRIRSE